jgi:hypothetical protein
VLFGALFGYLLSKARATDPDAILGMFTWKGFKPSPAQFGGAPDAAKITFPFADFQLYGVILVAVAVVALGMFLLRLKRVKDRRGEDFEFKETPFEWNRMPGGLLFGAGWVLAGACPGTAIAQLGEGRLAALFTVLGILLGVWLYMRFMDDPGSDCN